MAAKDFAGEIGSLRRYARALLGPHAGADSYITATLRSIIAGELSLREEEGPRAALFQAFHQLWHPNFAWVEDESVEELPVDRHLQALSPLCRAAFLLNAMEEFPPHRAGFILDLPAREVSLLVDFAYGEIAHSLRTDVLIIEDNSVVVLELRSLLRDLGHRVTGVAATHAQAVSLVQEQAPGLILADAQLADGSSGVSAVAEITRTREAPVIFITAYPQKIAAQAAPHLIVPKPFLADTLRQSIDRALLFRHAA